MSNNPEQSCDCNHEENSCGCEHEHHDHNHEKSSCGCEHEHHEHEDCNCDETSCEDSSTTITVDHCCESCAAKSDFSDITGERSNNAENDEDGSALTRKVRFICMIVGAVIFFLGLINRIFHIVNASEAVSLAIFLVAYILIGNKVLFQAIKNISKGKVFDENFLMSVASIGAFAIGEYPEGVAVMLFYMVGESFQDRAVDKSKRAISALMDIRPESANLITPDGIQVVAPETINIGELISVKAGERIPLDGVIKEGTSSLDTSALTGESLPADVGPSSEVLSGSINISGLLTIEVTRGFKDSAVMKILDLVQNASASKAPAENFITKFARYYTPVVVIAAVLLALIPPLLIESATFSEWINRALVFLVVSCPCALVVSIPLSYFGGIGGASKNGILIKGGNYLEALSQTKIVVFDKTGTLTKGKISVSKIIPSPISNEEEVLNLAAIAEQGSTHPIGAAILAKRINNSPLSGLTNYEEISGKGIKATASEGEILAGNSKLMDSFGIAFDRTSDIGSVVYVAKDKQYIGCIVLSDELKKDSKLAIDNLKKLGIVDIAMLSGDNTGSVKRMAEELGITQYYAELLPADKVSHIAKIRENNASNGRLVFVGDGINDAPVLAASDVGIAMGGLGSDAAIEAADAVLMTDEPSKLATAIKIAKKTHVIVLQNIIFALGVKAILLILGAFGIANMWAAVFGDVGVALIAILNAMRALTGRYS